MLIIHVATPVMVFLGIAVELEFIDTKNAMLARSAMFAKMLLER